MSNSPHPWFAAYLRDRETGLKTSSRKVYEAWWRRFTQAMGESELELTAVTPSDVSAFLDDYRNNVPLRYFKLLSDVYAAAERNNLCTTSPCRPLEPTFRYRKEERLDVPRPDAQTVSALFGLAHQKAYHRADWKPLRDRAMVLLTADAGLRSGEVRTLELDALRLEASPAKLYVSRAPHQRTLELGEQARNELQNWLMKRRALQFVGTLLFPATLAGEPLDPSTVYRIIDRYLKRVGAGKGATGTSGARALRSSFAERVSSQSPEPNTHQVQKLLGHRRTTSTVELLTRMGSKTSSK